MAISKAERRRLVDLSAAKKFGRWWDWGKPVLGHSIGPSNPNAFDAFAEGLEAIRNVCREALHDLSDHQLLALQVRRTNQDRDIYEWFENFLTLEIGKLSSNCPVWLAAGFGHPEVKADFEYWGQMARYSLHEVLSLSVGAEPEMIPDYLTAPLKPHEKKPLNPQAKFLKRRRILLEGHFPSTDWGILEVTPSWIKNLVDEISLEVHPEFYSQLERRLERSIAPVQNAATFSDHERQSLLKLIAAMSAEQYAFDPKNNRNTATGSIESDLNTTGLSLDRKTILKHLRDASELIDPTYWTKD